jgi:hypothetical protein
VLTALPGLISPAGAAPTLGGGSSTNLAGTSLTVPFSFTGASNVVALQFDVSFDSNKVTTMAASAGAATGSHTLDSELLSNSVRRVVVYSLTNGFLQNGVIVNAPLGISALALEDATGLFITNAILSDSNGQPVTPVTLVPGSVYISTALPARFSTILYSPSGVVQFLATGGNQRQYLIQASFDLVNWDTIGSVTAVNGLLSFTDETGEFTRRFYRAILSP